MLHLIARPMAPRRPDEPHRAATTLELFFDLISVVAIATAAEGLHHAIIEAHVLEGIGLYLWAFFAIWWAWMNFTWFASAYDNDDTLYRLIVMVIMAGSLTMAAGISAVVKSFDPGMVIIGYVIMRLGMICLWLRAAANDEARRRTALTYATGIFIAQLYWVLFYFFLPLPLAGFFALTLVGIVLELLVPVLAERQSVTPWHRHHIIERYGLLNIIVLGETILSGVLALEKIADGDTGMAFLHIAIAALVIVFAMWWLYFSREDQMISTQLRHAIVWGYGHYIVFAAGAAVGAGFAALIDIAAGKAHVAPVVGHYAVAIPIAIYLLGLWLVRDQCCFTGVARYVLPGFAALLLIATQTGAGIGTLAFLTVACVIVRNVLSHGRTVTDL